MWQLHDAKCKFLLKLAYIKPIKNVKYILHAFKHGKIAQIWEKRKNMVCLSETYSRNLQQLFLLSATVHS